VFEPGLDQLAQTVGVDPDTRRNQVDVEPGRGGSCDEFDEIAAHQGLAAGEMYLQDAQCSRLCEHSAPARGVKRDAGPRELQRV
jgi:hypothetical protein